MKCVDGDNFRTTFYASVLGYVYRYGVYVGVCDVVVRVGMRLFWR